jgi:hypothetical protein
MASSRRRDRLATFQELLDAQRAAVPRCSHCGGNCPDRRSPIAGGGGPDGSAGGSPKGGAILPRGIDRARDQQLALEAMRTHIRVLEAAWSLELEGAAKA